MTVVLLGAILLVLLAVVTVRAVVLMVRVGLLTLVGVAAAAWWLLSLPSRTLPR